MKKNRPILLAAMLVMLCCMFCGCTPTRYFTVVYDEIPESESVYILVKIENKSQLVSAGDEKLESSPIYNYEEDGWVIADRVRGLSETQHYKNTSSIQFSDEDELIDFCEKYKSVRVAYCDQELNPVSVTNQYSLLCKNKFAAVERMKFDIDGNRLETVEITKRNFFNDMGSDEVLILATVLTWLADIGLVIVLAIFAAQKPPMKPPVTIGAFCGISLFNVVLTSFFLMQYLDPYYNIEGDEFGKLELVVLALMNAPWLVAWVMLIVWILNRSRYTGAEQFPQYPQPPYTQ